MKINPIYSLFYKQWTAFSVQPTAKTSSQQGGQERRKKQIVSSIKKDHNGKYIPGSLFDIIV